MSKKESIPIQIRLPEKTMNKLKEIEEKNGLAPATEIRRIVCEKLN